MRKLPRFGSTSLNLASSAYADLGNPASLKNALSFTLEAWVNVNTLTGTQTIVSKHSDNTTGAFMLYLDNGYPATYYRTSPFFLKSSDAITANKWHHIATTYDSSSGTLTLYVDGVQKAQGTFAFTPSTGNTDNILIGADGGDTPTNFLQGMIGRVEIWSSVRTLDEIVADSVQVEDPSAEAFLQAHFDFTVLPAVDQSGNNIPISLQGGANYCMCIPGVKLENNAYVNCGNNADLSFGDTDPYTIEGWFYPTGDSGTIFSKFDTGTSEGEYSLELANSTLYAKRNIPPGSINSDAVIETSNSFYHFAVVFNGDDKTLSLFINGNLQTSEYFLQGVPASPTTDFLIGAILNNGTASGFFTGYIQNVRVWSKALNSSEIQQWMLNQPVTDPHLKASFDFSVNPPVDNTDQNTISLENGAVVDYQMIPIDPTDPIITLGVFDSINAAYMNQEIVTPDPPPTPTSFVEVEDHPGELLSEDFKERLRVDMEDLMERGGFSEERRDEHRSRFEESYARAIEMMEENPDLKKGFTTIRENGKVTLIHHGIHGDEVIFEGVSAEVDDCTLWWIQFIFKLTVGFLQAIGLAPSFGNIANRVYNLVSRNQTVINFLSTSLGKSITVAAGVGIVKVLYDQGLIWPIIKLALTSAGWWALAWILKKVIAIVTGLEAAEILAGFVVWAAQLTQLSLNYHTACPTSLIAEKAQS